MKFNLNEYLYNIGDELNGLKIIDKTRLNNQKAYEVQSLTYPDAPTYKTTEGNLKKGRGDGYLNGNRVYEGNSLYSLKWTHPYIKDIEFSKKVKINSSKKITLKCPNCGHEKEMVVAKFSNKGISCNICRYGISYPEKFFIFYLEEKNIRYEYQKTFQDFKSRRFDFYLPELNIIVETHGVQHYIKTNEFMSYKRTVKSDKEKREYCKSNNIKLIEINCSMSDFNFIRNNINNSELPNINGEEEKIKTRLRDSPLYYNINKLLGMYEKGYNLSEISRETGISRTIITNLFKKINKPINSSPRLIQITNEEFENIKRLYCKEKMGIDAIAKEYNISRTVIRRILVENSIRIDNKRKKKVKIKCTNTGETFDSVVEASKKYNIKSPSNIIQNAKGKQKYTGRHPVTGEKLYWEYVE